MITKETCRRIVLGQKKEMARKVDVVHRAILDDVMKHFRDNRVLILTGIRRSGKSTLLKQIMEKKPGCYVNFEDERLIDFQAQDFEILNEVLIEIYGEVKNYFFDEIQNVPKFETFVRRLQDENKKVLITGSNAQLLSKEFGTKLTGRYKTFEVYPFSFNEYLRYKKINFAKNDVYLTGKRVEILKAFKNYLLSGGFPEYLKNKDFDYLRTLYENILYKDIITRYSVKREKTLKELVSILSTNISRPFTYNSIKKNLGLANAITVKEYITYLNNSYLFFELNKFSYSVKVQLASPRKIYMIDTGLSQIIGTIFSDEKGRKLENAVFIELKRRGYDIFYYSDNAECDFLIKKGNKITEALQVCHNLTEENKDREIEGLAKAMENFNLNEGTILTYDQEFVIDNITVKPVWKYLLDI